MEITITDAELVLMRKLWESNPLNARQITEQVGTEKDWHRKTINTLLSRLEGKAAVSVQKHADGIKYYTPLIAEDQYSQSVTSQFVDNLFGGNITPLIASFAKDRPLSEAQIGELRELLEELSDDRK